jgi:hypothetical protein
MIEDRAREIAHNLLVELAELGDDGAEQLRQWADAVAEAEAGSPEAVRARAVAASVAAAAAGGGDSPSAPAESDEATGESDESESEPPVATPLTQNPNVPGQPLPGATGSFAPPIAPPAFGSDESDEDSDLDPDGESE